MYETGAVDDQPASVEAGLLGVVVIMYPVTPTLSVAVKMVTGILKLDFLGKELKIRFRSEGASYLGSFLIGVTFAAAWTPCAGPILGSILLLAGTKTSVVEGAKLLSVYSLGLGIPFLIAGVAINFFLEHFKKFEKVLRAVNVAGGILLVMVGIMLATNYFSVVSRFVLKMF